MYTFAFVNQKGGVGKTTSAINVAACLAQVHNKRVLLVDLDPQATATTGLGFNPENIDPKMEGNPNIYHVLIGKTPLKDVLFDTNLPNLTLAPSDIVLAMADVNLPSKAGWDRFLEVEIDKVAADYDFCVIDGAPGFSVLSQLALITADTNIVPMQCQFYAIAALKQLQRVVSESIRRVKPDLDLLIFRTMYDARLTQSKKASEKIKAIAGRRFLTSMIHNGVDLQNASSQRTSIFDYANSSRAASEYRSLTKEILDYVKEKS